MKKPPKNRIFFIVSTVLTVLFIAFIFIHSTQNAEISGEESLGVMVFFQEILNSFKIPLTLTDHIIRKTAHFCEFGVLGALVTLTFYSYDKCTKLFPKRILNILFVCLATAVTDETIQLFIPGRSGQVTDILLDFSGSAAGVTAVCLILLIIFHIKKKKNIS